MHDLKRIDACGFTVSLLVLTRSTTLCAELRRAVSGSPEAGEKAVALLRRMEKMSKIDEYDVRPDTISFNTCIKAFCKADAPYKAEEILVKLEKNPEYPKRNGGSKFYFLSAHSS